METLLISVAQTLLTLLTSVGGLISNTSELGGVLATLEKLIPFAEGIGIGLIGPIQSAIAILEGNDALSADQVTQLNTLKASADAAYATAWAAYSAAHPDPTPPAAA